MVMISSNKETIRRLLERGVPVGGNNKKKETSSSQEQEKKGPTILIRLTDIEDPQYAKQEVVCKAVIASNSVPYYVPKKLVVWCESIGKGHLSHKGEHDVELKAEQMAQYVEISSRVRGILNEKIGKETLTQSCSIGFEELAIQTVYRVRIRPVIRSLIFQEKKDHKYVDEDTGTEYKSYDICIEGKRGLEPGSVYELTGTVAADPRSQRVSLFATKLARDESHDYNLQNIRELYEQLKDKGTVEERVNWYTTNFEKYSKIVKREDVIIASLLAYFSQARIRFLDGKPERTWTIIMIVGDTTTAKSEVVKALIRLLNGGQYVVAENASIVGLSAAATQTANGQWFTEWGPLVLCDRKLLAIDGAQKLPRKEWASLAETWRSGVMRQEKAAKGEANAHTRQILIANPIDFEGSGYGTTTREIDSFLHPYLALPTVMDKQSIARLDLAVFVSSGDVTAKEINKSMTEQPDSCLFNLKDLRAFVWEDKRYQIEYEEGFAEKIYYHATELYNKFHVRNCEIVSIDMKFKLYRLSIALAFLTCSFKDSSLSTVVVSKDHVDYISGFLDKIYTKAGLHEGAEKDRSGSEIEKPEMDQIVAKIYDRVGGVVDKSKIIKVIKWMGFQQPSFSKDQIHQVFELNRDKEVSPLVSILQSEGLIWNNRRGFVITGKGVKAVRLLKEEKEEGGGE